MPVPSDSQQNATISGEGVSPVPQSPVRGTAAYVAPVHRPAPLFPLWAGWLLLLALAGLGTAVWYHMRRAAFRAWQTYATEIGGEFQPKNQLSPAYVSGNLGERALFLETALSYEDDAPYFHTQTSMPIRNPGGLILGLRRKSMLEEVQTRKRPEYAEGADLGSGYLSRDVLKDPEFERRFFLLCNDPDHLPELLTPEARRELSRYSDVEIYIRLNRIEWRRAGEQSDLPAIRRLNLLLAQMADTLDALPSRKLSLTERLADEARIAKGI